MTKHNPLVSVISGAYNINEKQAELAINSILDQTYDNFEFIICDDGSTDNTSQILKKIAQRDHRIVLINNSRNLGLGTALNNCLKVAKGRYIARMDLDDYCVPKRLALQVKFLNDHLECDIVSSNGSLFDEDHKSPYGKLTLPENPSKKDFLFNSPFLHAGAMIRKTALSKVNNYRIAKETWRAEDYDLWMRMYANGSTGHNIQQPLYAIREDKKAYSRRKYKYRIDEMIVRYKGFKSLGLLPGGMLYVIKPLIVGLIPGFVMKRLRKTSKK
ncbi:MAG: glycosyltransferase [Candidatus Saccharibacteria bacterium]|nr:glycosyltransferase [Candidatus Saccharibacteria bacterium]